MSRLSIDTDGKAYRIRDFSNKRELDIEFNISHWPEVEEIFDSYCELFDEFDPPWGWAEVVDFINRDLRSNHSKVIAYPDTLLTIYYRPSTGKLSF